MVYGVATRGWFDEGVSVACVTVLCVMLYEFDVTAVSELVATESV